MKPGEAVRPGDVLARVHARTDESGANGAARMMAAFTFADEPPAAQPLILKVIT
jgi:thymidine phosphorylase